MSRSRANAKSPVPRPRSWSGGCPPWRLRSARADRFDQSDQGNGIPCSVEKIPCSGRKNSLFLGPQGIGLQAFDLSDRLDTKNARKGRIRKNSLLNSLFSGNLRIAADPSQAQNRRVGKGALRAVLTRLRLACYSVGTLRFAHPTRR